MKYKEIIEQQGILFKRKYKQELDSISNLKKGKARERINTELFDVEDSLADTTKMLFLVIAMLKRLYDVNFDITQLSQDDKDMIEYALNKYSEITTWLDVKFNEEGIALIDKLADRQNNLANIIKEVYNG